MKSQRQSLSRGVSDAALFLDGDLGAWLQRVADAIALDLDRGCGVQVVLFDPSRPRTPALAGAVNGGPPGLLEYVMTINERSEDGEAARITTARVGQLCTFRELAGGSAGVRFFEDKPLEGIIIKDWLAFMLPLGKNRILMAGGFSTNEARIKSQQRQNWSELGPILSTGLNLQLSAAAVRGNPFDSGRRSFAGASLPGTPGVSARHYLREVAQQADRAHAEQPLDARADSTPSSALVDGSWTLMDRFDADGRRLSLAVPNQSRNPAMTLTPRQRQVVKLAAEGLSNKEIAYELRVTESTVGSLLAAALHLLKLRRREELVMALRVRHRTTIVTCGAQPVKVMSQPVPQVAPISGLTSSESEVAVQAANGVSTRNIAGVRGVSSRTVVNQLSSVYRKLGVASRAELASLLAKQKST